MLALLVLRSLATSATVAGGGVGGLFIPLVVAGALTGAVVGGAINETDLDLFIVIGVAAFLGAGYRVPLAVGDVRRRDDWSTLLRRSGIDRGCGGRVDDGFGLGDSVPGRPRVNAG